MKQTEHYGFLLMESEDLMSAKPLNENAEAMDEVLQEQRSKILSRLMMATGKYTGNGSRTVTINTPGFKPKVLMLREINTGTWVNHNNVCWWLGENISVTYKVYARVDEDSSYGAAGELREEKVAASIAFTAQMDSLSWSIPPLPEKYYDVGRDEGPEGMSNQTKREYEWIAFGTAE